MDIQSKVKTKFDFVDVGALCPHCNTCVNIGDIHAKIQIDATQSISEILNIQVAGCVLQPNPDDGYLYAPTFLKVACPACTASMIIIDNGILDLVTACCEKGLYTTFSCEGHSDSALYVAFFDPLPQSLWEQLERLKYTCVEEGGTIIRAKRRGMSDDYDEAYVFTPKQRKTIVDEWMSTIGKWCDTDAGKAYTTAQKAKYPQLEDRYNAAEKERIDSLVCGE